MLFIYLSYYSNYNQIRQKLESPHSRTHRRRTQQTTSYSAQWSTRDMILFSITASAAKKRSLFSCDLEFWPMPLTYKPDLDRVKVNHHLKYHSQTSFPSKLNIWTHTYTHRQIALHNH